MQSMTYPLLVMLILLPLYDSNTTALDTEADGTVYITLYQNRLYCNYSRFRNPT